MAGKWKPSSELTRGKRVQRKAYVAMLASALTLLVISFLEVNNWVDLVFIFIDVLSLFVIFAASIADKAEKKGRSWEAFFWLSMLFSPILMLIIVELISPLPSSVAHSSSESAARASFSPDLMDQIKKLGDLRDQGLITDQDFEAKKNELLNRI